MIQSFKDFSYEEGFEKVWTTTPEKRRSRGDLIKAYKIITERKHYGFMGGVLWLIAPSKVTRVHRYKLFKKPKRTLGQNFFSASVVDLLWNELHDSIVSVDNVTAFKRILGKLGYHSIVICSGFNTDYTSSEPLKTLVMLLQYTKSVFSGLW